MAGIEQHSKQIQPKFFSSHGIVVKLSFEVYCIQLCTRTRGCYTAKKAHANITHAFKLILLFFQGACVVKTTLLLWYPMADRYDVCSGLEAVRSKAWLGYDVMSNCSALVFILAWWMCSLPCVYNLMADSCHQQTQFNTDQHRLTRLIGAKWGPDSILS